MKVSRNDVYQVKHLRYDLWIAMLHIEWILKGECDYKDPDTQYIITMGMKALKMLTDLKFKRSKNNMKAINEREERIAKLYES